MLTLPRLVLYGTCRIVRSTDPSLFTRCGELAHAICIGHTIYFLVITNYGHPETLARLPSSLIASTLIGSLVSCFSKEISAPKSTSPQIIICSPVLLCLPNMDTFQKSFHSLDLLGTVIIPTRTA
jgi:hypothetical protein